MIINKAKVRDYTMAAIAEKRPALKDKMTRVSGEFFEKVDAATRNFIQAHVSAMPSSGKTVK